MSWGDIVHRQSRDISTRPKQNWLELTRLIRSGPSPSLNALEPLGGLILQILLSIFDSIFQNLFLLSKIVYIFIF